MYREVLHWDALGVCSRLFIIFCFSWWYFVYSLEIKRCLLWSVYKKSFIDWEVTEGREDWTKLITLWKHALFYMLAIATPYQIIHFFQILLVRKMLRNRHNSFLTDLHITQLMPISKAKSSASIVSSFFPPPTSVLQSVSAPMSAWNKSDNSTPQV